MSFSARAGSQVGWSGALEVALSLFLSDGFLPEGGAGAGAGAAPGGSSAGGGAWADADVAAAKNKKAAKTDALAAERRTDSSKEERRK